MGLQELEGFLSQVVGDFAGAASGFPLLSEAGVPEPGRGLLSLARRG